MVCIGSTVGHPTTTRAQDLESAFAEAVAGRRVLVRRGPDAVAVIPIHDLEQLELLDDQEDADLRAASEAVEAADQGQPSVSWSEVKRRAGLT